jgi:hypothetical protein
VASIRQHVKTGQRRRLGGRLGWGVVAAIGYILSPLSWWNDGFVNIPLALLSAKLLTAVLHVDFVVAFYTSYAATNVAGMMLLYLGAGGVAGRVRFDRRSLARQILVALAYSIAVYPILKLLGLT